MSLALLASLVQTAQRVPRAGGEPRARREASQDSQDPWVPLAQVGELGGMATAAHQGRLVSLQLMAWLVQWARQAQLVPTEKTEGWAHQGCLVLLAVTGHQAKTARTGLLVPRVSQESLGATGSQVLQEFLCKAHQGPWVRQGLQDPTGRARRW